MAACGTGAIAILNGLGDSHGLLGSPAIRVLIVLAVGFRGDQGPEDR
jgi:hypothetical protein